MEQSAARQLFDVGAMLILQDVPRGTEIGIDMHSWQIAENFKGIKMIPPGLHFVYFRTGFFRRFSEREVVVRKWNSSVELFDPEIVNEEELNRYVENKKEMDRYCGPYPYDSYKKWLSLSQHVTDSQIARVQPHSGYILSACSLLSESSDTVSRAAKSTAEPVAQSRVTVDNLMPDMKPQVDDVMHYTPVYRFLAGSDSSTITKCALDSSAVLEDFIARSQSWQNVIGELQISFICFLIGQQFDSFDQWKKLVALVCGSSCSITKYEEMYTELIGVLHFQLKEIPEDFFVDIVSSDNFLTTTLHELFTNLSASAASQQLKSRGQRFSDHLTKTFGWDFEAEADDCAPVVVDEMGNY